MLEMICNGMTDLELLQALDRVFELIWGLSKNMGFIPTLDDVPVTLHRGKESSRNIHHASVSAILIRLWFRAQWQSAFIRKDHSTWGSAFAFNGCFSVDWSSISDLCRL